MTAEAPAEEGPATGSRANNVYEWLRERIIDGSLPPGARIREREIAEELQVSRVPVREALPQLESEGYIETLPRRGAVVVPLTVNAAVELFDVRASLEVLAARLAAQACAAGASPAGLEALLERAHEATEAADEDQIADLNSRLHEEILVLSGNRLLQKLMTPVNGHVRRLFHVAKDRDQEELYREHVAIVQAISRGHAELAAALSFAHVEESRNESLPIVERQLEDRPHRT
ncbi:GntR family transcriptional regulator [Sinomonas sp. ASV322]|uniref:GntR family transcriptional regulator n=1 Tax=Sinomonas sp. ASV322 TaxID=3041920 RepID=UPI0027DE1B93|nr:GntR family transcriptional regulator [Sinomonas sp. ASV322]MDQ4504005.1 GntR family transcriptional regulator [Sinomonas sp. ASV322]